MHGRSPLQLAQSKLKLLQKHMSGDRTGENSARSCQTLEVSFPAKPTLKTIEEVPAFDNAYVSNQAVQVCAYKLLIYKLFTQIFFLSHLLYFYFIKLINFVYRLLK